ncbi:MAG: alpha-2-macroglobulin [Reyranellales bacterium]
MNRSTWAALVVALMLGSGIAGYLIGSPRDTVDRTPPTRTAQTTPTTTPATPAQSRPGTTPASQPTTQPAPQSTPGAQVPRPVPVEAFRYSRLSLDNSSAEAEACLYFNKPLATDNVKYADYLRITPEVKSAIRVVDDKLCIGGLAYGQDYAVTLLAGFPSASGGKLEDERKVSLALGPRPAAITLPGKGFILPRGTAAGLPVTTVNVGKLGISVYRVNERGLQQFTGGRYYYDSSNNFPGTEPVTESWNLRQWLNGENGKRIWRGTMAVKNVQNQAITTAFPIRETIKDWKPGAYFVVVWNSAKPPAKDDDDTASDDDEENGKNAAGMWVMDTDIALTSLTGRDGLTVLARSLASAQPLPNAEVVLLSRGNEPIGKAVTDAQGRALPGPIDAFLYTERGVYRPGETVHLVAMMRDDSANAIKDMPVTLTVNRPDGTEFTRYTLPLPASGALYQAIDIPKSSRRGLWSVSARIDPKGAPVGRVEFSVEDFVPEKLKVELSTDATVLRTGKIAAFDVSADFLYGAPASGLKVESDLRVVVDPNPFPAFAAYDFGSQDERKNYEPPLITLTGPDTDDKGKSKIEWAGDQVKDTGLPLRAQLTARVFEPGNGRATKTEKSLPLRTRDVYLGIKSTFDGRYAREGVDTGFDIVALGPDGKQIADSVEYSLERITYNYQWYLSDGHWRWQSVTAERQIDAGTMLLKADAPVSFAKHLDWGPHKLTITDKRANVSTIVTFYVGWWGGDSSAEAAPDTLKVASDREKYAPGDTAKLRIEAPFAGEAVVTIATDKVYETLSTQVPAGGTTIDVPVKAEWGAGAYAVVTAWRPLATPAERTPVRAIGATWLGIDPGLRTLQVQLAAPERVTPRQRIEVPLHVTGTQGQDAYVTLAAVDEGILQLTRFKTPKPADYYFGKRQLGLAVRDDYGRLLDTKADELGKIRTGGDAGDIGGLDIVPTRTVALFSGPVKLDDKGEAKIALEIPDFIGQLRLMAVAYDKTKVGSADQRMFVRDAVTADVILPRFLAPSDTARVALSLHNVEGQAGDYKVTLEATGSVSLEWPVSQTQHLNANQRELLGWPLKAGDVGLGKVVVAVSGPGNFSVRRDWDIQVRAAQTPSAVDTTAPLEASRELTVDHEVISPFAAGTAQVSVALSRIPGIDVPGLLRALDKYPHGCIEQTTSRALPLLYYNDVALLGYGPADPRIADRVQEAIYRIVDMQMADGSFGMWGPYSSPAAEWLQAYATDFLLRARDQKMAVPAASLSRALTWLSRSVEKMSPDAQAYGWYVLAKAGLADVGRVRYFQDAKGSDIVGGLAWTQLAAALNQVGEPGRARLAFGWARQRIDQRDTHDYYGSALRDRAALLALAKEAGGTEGLQTVANVVREKMVARVEYTTTQEQAWLVLAAHAMAGDSDLAYSVDGDTRHSTKEPVVLNPDAAAIEKGVHIRNQGDRPIWLQVTARGVPKEPQSAAVAGLSVGRTFYTLDGKIADLEKVRQNDRLVVSIEGYNEDRGYHQVALLDLLPAGFEIESVVNKDTVKNFSFLPNITRSRIAEAPDDRFFAAFDLGRRTYSSWWDSDREELDGGYRFHVAYIVRAVTPGSFALPAVHVSDMYAPRVFGRTAMDHVTIAPR